MNILILGESGFVPPYTLQEGLKKTILFEFGSEENKNISDK